MPPVQYTLPSCKAAAVPAGQPLPEIGRASGAEPGTEETAMKRLALPLGLGGLWGCGGSAPAGMSDAQMVETTVAELRSEGPAWLFAAGLDEIQVPPDVFGTTTPV